MKKQILLLFIGCLLTVLTAKAQSSVSCGIINTIAGGGTGSVYSGIATSAALCEPNSVWGDNTGNLYIADYCNYTIDKVDAAGNVTVIAGNSTPGFSGDGGPATAAEVDFVYGITLDKTGNIYFVDGETRIRKINVAGIISTIAGTGAAGYGGDGGPATAALLDANEGLAIDTMGNLYIADVFNNRIRKIDIASGVITTIAGNGTAGYTGDGGPATAAELNMPYGIGVDQSGNVYIADTYNNLIRKINASGIISTICGNGTAGNTGNGGPATAAELSEPYGLYTDSAGTVFFSEFPNSDVRKVSTDGILTLLAGTTSGFSGDGGVATSAQLSDPCNVWEDKNGNVYICDMVNNRVREVGTCVTTGVAEIPVVEKISIFPNPSTGQITISGAVANVTNDPRLSITVRDCNGQTIYTAALMLTGGRYERQISLQDFEDGVYFITVKTGDATETQPIALVR